LVLANSKSLSEITLSGLVEILKKEGKFPANGSVAGGSQDPDEQTG
jgi:hypothetical protein